MAENEVLVRTDPAASLRNMLRQFAVMVALAATVAIGVGVALWSQEPAYSLLAGDMNASDLTEIQSVLQADNIPFRIDGVSGGIMVPSSRIEEVRLKLAALGLPKSSMVGFEMLQQEQGFGTSQFIEKARYQMALESELTRSITKLSNVRGARVHLALPKESVFARDRRNPSASVLVNLYPGRVLEQGQVDAIRHMVASSVPNLALSQVTVIDQLGRLLSGKETDSMVEQSGKRFDYVKRLEDSYIRRIENILSPIVGFDGVKAQVTAEVDFTMTQQASESFNPDLPATRSEQIMEENRIGPEAAGIPGAVTNQPPGAGVAPEQTEIQGQAGIAEGGGTGAAGNAGGSRRKTIRNYELDKTISHMSSGGPRLQRLSVAVVVNNRQVTGGDGQPQTMEYPPEEINRFTLLVREAVGFNPGRGDTVNVIATDFTVPQTPEPLPEQPLWQQQWVIDLALQVIGWLVAIVIAFGVLKPIMRSMLQKNEPDRVAELSAEQRAALEGGAATAEGKVPALPAATAAEGNPQLANMSPAEKAQALLSGADDYENELDQVKAFVTEEPKLAAQVVKNWVGAEQ